MKSGDQLPGAEMKEEATTRQRPAGATSTGDGEPLPEPKMRNQDLCAGGRGQPPRRTDLGQGATAWIEDEGSRPPGRRGQLPTSRGWGATIWAKGLV